MTYSLAALGQVPVSDDPYGRPPGHPGRVAEEEMARRPCWARPAHRGLEALGQTGGAIIAGGMVGSLLLRKRKRRVLGAVLGAGAGLLLEGLLARCL